MKQSGFLLLFFLFIVFTGNAQLQPFSLNGYVKDLYMYYKPDRAPEGIEAEHLSSNLIHNRLNFRWYATDVVTFGLEARNRLFCGQLVREFPLYEELVDTDPGFFDLSATLLSGESWFLHAMIDRAWIDFTKGKWQFTAGRQRINWGINLVWNPNDIFNTFDYFDFDYEERPGSDALKIKYYTGVTSSAELAYKIHKNRMEDKTETTIAARYRFSKFRYDFQFLGGRMPEDVVIGGGWMGDIHGAGFRGEISWFTPREQSTGGRDALVAAISGDYTFKNSLYVHAAVLYNSMGESGNAGSRAFFDQNISAKMLSPARSNVFGQLTYPFTPLFTGNVTAMLNPSDHFFYLGPSCTWSLGNNLELLVMGQLFSGAPETEYGELGKAIYGRLKWAF